MEKRRDNGFSRTTFAAVVMSFFNKNYRPMRMDYSAFNTEVIIFQLMCLLIMNRLVVSDTAFIKFGMIEKIPEFFLMNHSAVDSNEAMYVGSWVNGIEWLSKRLKFTYHVIPVGQKFGKPSFLNGSGSWSGAAGRLLQGDFDVLVPPQSLNYAASVVFDYIGVVDEDNSILITPALTEESTLFSIFKPFELKVWLLIVGCLLSVAISLAALSTINDTRFNWKRIYVGEFTFSTMAILLNQGQGFSSSNLSRLPFRLICSVWCLLAVVIVNLYCGTLTAHITTRKMSTAPKDTLEILQQGLLIYLLADTGVGPEIIMGATSGPLKKLGDFYRSHPEYLVPNAFTAFPKVASGCCAYNGLESLIYYLARKDFDETGKCRVHLGKPFKGYGSGGALVKKSDPYRGMFNTGIMEMYQTGLIGYWQKQFSHKDVSICLSQRKSNSKKLRRLNLHDFFGVFFILCIGSVVSLLAFLAEKSSAFLSVALGRRFANS